MILRRVASRLSHKKSALLCGLALLGQATQAAPAQSPAEEALMVRLPTKALLLDAAWAGPRAVAVGAHGVIIASDDRGANWVQSPVPSSGMLTCVTFSDATHGWAAGHSGIVLATVDAGKTWLRAATPTGNDDSFLDILALPDGRVFAVGAYGLFLASADRGATWEKKRPFDEDLHLNRITCGASGTLYLAAESGMLAASNDRGATWVRIEVPYEGSFFGLHELTSGRFLAHGLRGHAYFSDDRGATWTQSTIEHSGLLATAVEVTAGTVAVSGAGGKIFISRDGGATFAAGPATGLTATAELIAAGETLICVGDSGVRIVALPKP